jgi:hypothetical protein
VNDVQFRPQVGHASPLEMDGGAPLRTEAHAYVGSLIDGG